MPAGKRHARLLNTLLRPEDRQEIWESGRFLPEQAARASINRCEEAWALYVGNDLLAVFGVSTYDTGWAAPWAFSTVHVAKYPLTFWRVSKIVLAHWRDRYPKMVQMIYARYPQALAWVKRLGFKVEEPVPWGWNKSFFCRVSLETAHVRTSNAT